jgi:hypothetical protein
VKSAHREGLKGLALLALIFYGDLSLNMLFIRSLAKPFCFHPSVNLYVATNLHAGIGKSRSIGLGRGRSYLCPRIYARL